MDDSSLYTGVDGELNEGMFGNEKENEDTKELKENQSKLLKELTPKLQGLLDLIDAEIESVTSIDRFITATIQSEGCIRAELQAAALYKQYLSGLKTKFTLQLNEVKK